QPLLWKSKKEKLHEDVSLDAVDNKDKSLSGCPNCGKLFIQSSTLQRHIDQCSEKQQGKEKTQQFLQSHYYINQQKQQATLRPTVISSTIPSLIEPGRGRKQKRKHKKFSIEQKDFLINLFEEGIGGTKSTAGEAQKRMQALFGEDDVLQVDQITSFWSRYAKK